MPMTLSGTTGIVQPTAAAPAFSAYISSQTISSNVWTKLMCSIEEFDTNNNFDSASNYRFTPTVSGYYQFNGKLQAGASATPMALSFYKNGSAFKDGQDSSASVAGISSSALIYLNGSTDYVELYAYLLTGQILASGIAKTYFQAFLARSA